MTMPVVTDPVENSGSLTGHILAQGWRDEIVDRRRGNVKVAIAMLVVLGLLVTVSLVFLFHGRRRVQQNGDEHVQLSCRTLSQPLSWRGCAEG